jgi:hypothetical protein
MVQLDGSHPGVGIVSAGVDWITLTGKHSDSRLQLGVLARRQARVTANDGNQILPWSWSGYQGFKVRGLQWGEREDSTCVRLTSDCALNWWWDFYQWSEKVTRVDWQVTYRFPSNPKQVVLDHAKAAKRYWGKRRDGPTLTVVSDDREGATLYLGRRSSRVYLRVYNKAAESKEQRYANCVRYEVELKDVAARLSMVQLSDGRMVQSTLISQVHRMFDERGVAPPWKPVDHPLRIQWPKRNHRYPRKASVVEESGTSDSRLSLSGGGHCRSPG